MTMTTRSRLSLLLAIAVVLVAGISGAQYVGASSQPVGGPEPGSGGGGDGVAGICVAPAAPADGEGQVPSADECNDTIEDPIVSDPGDCGEKVSGTGPDAVVSYTPCPGDEDPVVTDPYDGAQKVEPRPGMSGVNPTAFDKVVVGDDGRTLTIVFWSGVEPCYVLDHVDVDAGGDEITVTLYQGHDATAGDVACIDIALLKKVVVQLDEPIGDRRIVDGGA